ncbi:TonB-dependent receptor plug domain-containing protein [Tenacibaculum sp. nBUS_03]|uniref:TonB-dependent receptor plug domain-containing protein n=1 Tax=Tenacibaculum sp. nBUS_03 TaxID=3395320 RepID=UPI003EC00EAF
MFLNRFLGLGLGLISISVFSQERIEVKKDSIKENNLDEVVVTGQLRPQSVKKSVFEVKVITRKDIENRAGNNLADLLNQTLNVSVFQNSSTGKSGINVLGLDAKYFKVLVDNIPIVNEEGFGNNTDLTLINIDDIERVELVEGAMGVQYGANALSGVINIITKKSSKSKINVKAYVQEETVGEEYELFEKGRHIQSLSLGYKISNKNYINLSYNRNDFRGYLDSLKGKHHDKSDELRGHVWFPKQQNNAKLLFNRKGEKLSLFYKFDYLHESIDDYNKVVQLNTNTTTLINNPSASDNIFRNIRYLQHLNLRGKLWQLPFNVSFSHQKQTKDQESFTYFIYQNAKSNVRKNTFLSKEVWFSRGTLADVINTNRVKLQIGYEFVNEKGFSSRTRGRREGSNTLTNYDVFTSSEVNVNDSFSIKPGIRASFTNLFDTQFYYSVSARHLFKNNWEARAILGFGTRTPKYDELYTYVVDTNHNIQGNEGLNPEKGLSTFFHVKKHSNLTDEIVMKNKFTFSYIKVDDRIELIVQNETPLEFKYNNIDEFKSIGGALENQFIYNNLQLNLGFSFFRVKKSLGAAAQELSNTQNNWQINANLSYKIPNWNTTITGYSKYLGATNRFIQIVGAYRVQRIDPYSWLDVAVRKDLLNKKIQITGGVRNLLDVTNNNTNTLSGGAHAPNINSVSLSYGRYLFFKVSI